MQDILHPFIIKIDENSSARERILAIAFEEMYEHGFQGLRIDRVLEKTQLTKGALYHHFTSKKALGYAVVDELIQGQFRIIWTHIDASEDPITIYQNTLRSGFSSLTPEEISRGCPLNNLVQEMAGLDEGFQTRLNTIYNDWKTFTEGVLKKGQSEGSIRSDINSEAVAVFIISSIQGIKGMGKCAQCSDTNLVPIIEELCNYMDTLRV